MQIINREHYIQKIKPYIGKELIKVLVGARRCGKTYLMYQLMEFIRQNNPGNIIYINMEEHEFKDIKNHEDLFAFVVNQSETNHPNHVFIDEVQEVDGFELALRQLLIKGYDIYCTGSNAKMLSSDLATHLSGRFIEFQIYSLTFQEFLQFHKLENTNESLLKFIRYGGLPYLLNLEFSDEIIYGYLKSVYSTIILKDIVARFNIRDVDFLERLTDYLAENLGSYVSSPKITAFLKSQHISLSVNTVLNYLQYLCNSFFIDKVKRFDIQGKKVFEVNDKFYFRDLGLKHAVNPYKAGDIGKVMENLVYNKLVFDGYKVNLGKLGNKEIDFVATRLGKTKYIQVAYLLPDQKTIDREFGNLLEINDNYLKIVVSSDELQASDYKGIQHMNIKDFLAEN